MWLSSEHIKTLSELESIAEKHGYKMSFKISYPYTHVDDFSITDLMIKSNEDLEFIEKNNLEINGHSTTEEYCLYIQGKNIFDYHELRYSIHSGYCVFDIEEYEELESDYELYGEYSEDIIYFDFTNTEIIGFKNVKHEPNIYRSGMLIREFGHMLCELLGEPRITRNY